MFETAVITTSRVVYLCSYCKPRYHTVRRVFSSNFSTTALASRNADASIASQDKFSSDENQISLLNHKAHLQRKTLLKIKRTPFMKNLFLGLYDKDALAFPEIHDNKEIDVINRMSDQVRKYVLANVNSEQIDKSSIFPNSVLEDLKKMGLYGGRVPKEYGGLELTATEYVRLMEACSVDSALPALLNSHHSIAAQALLNYGSEDLKRTYLHKLASGDLTAAFGFSEQLNENDISCINTVASKLQGNSQYLLSGKKTWVVNAENADLFLVLAKNVDPEDVGMTSGSYATFLVERDSPGVFIHKPDEKLGIRGANMCSVEFRETPVPLNSIVGSSKNGFQVALNIMMMNRFHIGAFTTGLAKALVEIATDYCINTNLFEKPLMDYESAKYRVGKILWKAYAMESLTYLTAGLFDSTENPDLNLEYSAVKVFCTESLWFCVNELLSLMGPTASLSGHPVERICRDSRMWLMFESPNDFIRQYISLSAISHCKEILASDVQKLRNPMFHPRFSFKRYLENLRFERGNLKLSLDLQGYLHPTLQIPANYMEYSVQKLKHGFERLLQLDGPQIVNHDVNLFRLADMAIGIYVMTAVCSRASRSYCIGLPCAEAEVTLAVAICQDGYSEISTLHDEILRSPAGTTDVELTRSAKLAFLKQGYCLTPPFTRTY